MKKFLLALFFTVFSTVVLAEVPDFNTTVEGDLNVEEIDEVPVKNEKVYAFDVNRLNGRAKFIISFNHTQVENQEFNVRDVKPFYGRKVRLNNFNYSDQYTVTADILRSEPHYFLVSDTGLTDNTYLEEFKRCSRMLNPDTLDIPLPACEIDNFWNHHSDRNIILITSSGLILALTILLTGLNPITWYRKKKMMRKITSLQDRIVEENNQALLQQLLEAEQDLINSDYESAEKEINRIERKIN